MIRGFAPFGRKSGHLPTQEAPTYRFRLRRRRARSRSAAVHAHKNGPR